MKSEQKSPKKYSVEELKVAQIPAMEIDKRILRDLEDSASFVDTDESLIEFMVSVDVLPTLSSEYEQTNKKELAILVDELYKQVGEYSYIQILKI